MPRLPPVEKSPHGRLRFTLSPGVGYSVTTFFQSHSSSSATICARPVIVPCPISERAQRITTVSFGWITTQALISGEPSAARTTSGPPKGRRKPRARPPVAAAVEMMKERRFILMMCSSGRLLGDGMDRFAHLLEGAAAADVRDRGVDVRVGGLGLLLEEGRHRHDHPRLAVAALRHVVLDPGLLHLGELAALGEAFDGRDLLSRGRAHREGAGAHRRAVDMHGARAALRDAAAVFRSGKADLLANRPEQRRVRVDVDLLGLAIDGQRDHFFSSGNCERRYAPTRRISTSAPNLDFRMGRHELEKLADVLVVHPHTAHPAALADLGAGGRAVDIDVAAHGVDVAEAVFARFAARKPQNPGQNPVAARVFGMHLGRPDLAGRPAAHENRAGRLAGADLGSYDVPPARGAEAAILLAGTPLRRRHGIGLPLEGELLLRNIDEDHRFAAKKALRTLPHSSASTPPSI